VEPLQLSYYPLAKWQRSRSVQSTVTAAQRMAKTDGNEVEAFKVL